MRFYPVVIKDVSSPGSSMYAYGIYVKSRAGLEYAYESQSAYDLGQKLGKVEIIKKNTQFPVIYTPPFQEDMSIAASSDEIIDYKIHEMPKQAKDEFIKGLRNAISGKE